MSETITPKVSDRICQHMNEDHGDAVILYAKVFGQVSDITHAEMLSIDSSGMDLKIEPSQENKPLRINFDHPLQDAEDAHHTLIDMVKQARQMSKKSE